MKIQLPRLVQDPQISLVKSIERPVESLTFDSDKWEAVKRPLDGPIIGKVAILDFDETTGQLVEGVRFVPPGSGDEAGHYSVNNIEDYNARDFIAVSVFANVLSTIKMFEENDALGREVEWAFDGPQLLVVPRAGEWANAFYERASRSLQFFYFPSSSDPTGETRIYTGLSQDIVAHETGHAVLDGIAPDLYHALSPQSLAIHEAIADLTALHSALRSRPLTDRLLKDTNGDVNGPNALSSLAEQFGTERDLSGRSYHLRSMWNKHCLDPGEGNPGSSECTDFVTRDDPHLLSEVLSGALYKVFGRLHDEHKAQRAADTGQSEESASGWALFVATEHFKRLVIRSLDYLPPGEVSFADYGRAIIASDQASYPNRSEGRDTLVEQFVNRNIVFDAAELDVRTDYVEEAVSILNLAALKESDWAAYDFAHTQRNPARDTARRRHLGTSSAQGDEEVLVTRGRARGHRAHLQSLLEPAGG